ncbi:hypothetical protein DdX_17783 [Ditylenchus destructor]|uniref:Uncharacterized protein n=1 Tax=Ditylenchus destructor TaxID=166010 RepID=A0AAD4QYP6_9BILA|nr:hypothetical protein DdX_17783 [Ditylenchus destructor]
MTNNTSAQKVAVFILLIIFVSSFSPVVASPKKKPRTLPSETGQPSSPSNGLTVTVHVVLPRNIRFQPSCINVILLPDVEYRPDLPQKELRVQWSACSQNKCKFEFSADAQFFAIGKYKLGVAYGENFDKEAWIKPINTRVVPSDSKLDFFVDSKLETRLEEFRPTRLETRLELFIDSAQPWCRLAEEELLS